MNEQDLRGEIAAVKEGRLSRRDFVQRMLAVGLTAPMAGMMVAHSGVAMAAQDFPYKPTKAGGGGPLKLLFWQAPTLLNPHFAIGTKDQEAARAFYEPLAGWDAEGNLVPVLAAEIPSMANGTVAADGTFVIWKLKQGVTWHDGHPFTADDVIFNWQYATDPETSAVTSGDYKHIKAIEKIDDHTIRVVFAQPTPLWMTGFVGGAKNRPAPISEAEVMKIVNQMQEGVEKPRPKVEWTVGEVVRVKEGPFTDFNGSVEEVNYDKSKVRVSVTIFGRATPVELDFAQVEKV